MAVANQDALNIGRVALVLAIVYKRVGQPPASRIIEPEEIELFKNLESVIVISGNEKRKKRKEKKRNRERKKEGKKERKERKEFFK